MNEPIRTDLSTGHPSSADPDSNGHTNGARESNGSAGLGGSTGEVRVDGTEVRIEHLTFTDQRSAEIIRERSDLGASEVELVVKAIEIGLRAMQSADTEIEAAYVRAEFDRIANQVSEDFSGRAESVSRQLSEIFDSALVAEDSQLQESLSAHSEALAEQIASRFDPERTTAVQHEVKKVVDEQLRGLVERLASESENNPLEKIKGEVLRTMEREAKTQAERDRATAERLEDLQRELVKLTERDAAQVQIDEAEAAGTRKGFAFEDLVHQAVEQIANARGDSSRHIGSEEAEGGGRKGDSLVEVGGATKELPLGRIVFEAKDKELSKTVAWKELDEAMTARSADFAVMVCAGSDRLPGRTDELVEYEGNKLFVAVDREDPSGLSLEVAYRLAVARVVMAKESSLTLDAPAVRDAVSEARRALDQVSTVKSHITHSRNAAEKAYQAVGDLGEQVRAQLDLVDDLVADEESDAADSV